MSDLEQQTTHSAPSLHTETTEDKKKTRKNKEDPLAGLDILEKPVRKLPKVIEEVLKNNIEVRLTSNGYYVDGFYGLGADKGQLGFAFAQETSEPDTLVFYDNKNAKHVIRNFEDLVKFNNHVWGAFFKLSEDYKKPDLKWFSFLLQYGVLSITPGSNK